MRCLSGMELRLGEPDAPCRDQCPLARQSSNAAGCSELRWPAAATGEGSGAQRRSLKLELSKSW